MISEDYRLVAGEQRIEFLIGKAMGCSVGGCSVIRLTTLTTRTFRLGHMPPRRSTAASVSSVGTSPAASHHDIRFAAPVVTGPFPDAQAGVAMPDACVHVSHCGDGCLPATMTLT